MSRESFMQGLPKIELHVHIEGTLEPGLKLKFKPAARTGVALPFKDAAETRASFVLPPYALYPTRRIRVGYEDSFNLMLSIEVQTSISLWLSLFRILSSIRLRFELSCPVVVIVPPPIFARLAARFLKRECPGLLLALRHGSQVYGRVPISSIS
jgi:hypothetical protein